MDIGGTRKDEATEEGVAPEGEATAAGFEPAENEKGESGGSSRHEG